MTSQHGAEQPGDRGGADWPGSKATIGPENRTSLCLMSPPAFESIQPLRPCALNRELLPSPRPRFRSLADE